MTTEQREKGGGPEGRLRVDRGVRRTPGNPVWTVAGIRVSGRAKPVAAPVNPR